MSPPLLRNVDQLQPRLDFDPDFAWPIQNADSGKQQVYSAKLSIYSGLPQFLLGARSYMLSGSALEIIWSICQMLHKQDTPCSRRSDA